MYLVFFVFSFLFLIFLLLFSVPRGRLSWLTSAFEPIERMQIHHIVSQSIAIAAILLLVSLTTPVVYTEPLSVWRERYALCRVLAIALYNESHVEECARFI